MHSDLTPHDDMNRIVNGKRYSVATATLLASNRYWDGNNFDRSGRNSFLYKTPQGAYFVANMTMWQGEENTLRPITEQEAIELYEEYLNEHEVRYEDAFPGVEVTDA